jgi:hypothetical protein
MSENILDIAPAQKFINASGLSIFWNNIVNYIKTIKDEITTIISANKADVDSKITKINNDITGLSSGVGSISTQIQNALNELNSTSKGTGNVVTNVSQKDGIVTVTYDNIDVTGPINTALSNLNVTTNESGKFVSKVTQTNGKINVTYSDPTIFRGYPVNTIEISNGAIVSLNYNTYYKIQLPSSGSVTISLNNPNANISSEYIFEFTVTGCTIALPEYLTWENDDILSPEEGVTYVVSIVNNKAVYGMF